jgi:hypothetical protein
VKLSNITLPYRVSAVLALLGQLSDCITTQIGLSRGAHEANPLMVWVTKHLWVEYPLKLSFAVLSLFICQKIFSPWKWGVLPILVFAMTGFGAAIWNLMQFRYL